MKAGLDDELLETWLGADPERLAQVARLIQRSADGLKVTITGAERETARNLALLLGNEAWDALLESGLELPTSLALRKLWGQRQVQCEEFETHLLAGDWTEPDWQRFFEECEWIFGFGLRYQFLHRVQGTTCSRWNRLDAAGWPGR